MSSVPRFYVYILARPNGRLFYIGKGSGRRVFDHDSEARSGHRCHKCNVIRKIWRQGGAIQRYIVFTTDDEIAAYAYESELIALHGRGNLTNGTDGGIGGRGSIMSPERRVFYRELRRANWADPEYRARMTAMSQTLGADPVWRAKVSAANKARLADPAERVKLSEAQRRRYEDPAEHAKQSAVNHIRWSDPAQRAALAARNRTDEMRAKVSTARTAQWADPGYRARRTQQVVCAVCASVFETTQRTAKFCSQRCKHKFYREHTP